jgi:DNA-binding MarR family transcriptional regulator
MGPEELRTLKLLEELEKDHAPSQRDLARTLDVSLGLVNSFLKRLVSKGYFKVTTIPKNRVRYILTPKGAAEKTRLTLEYIQYSLQFYKSARANLQALFHELAESGARRVALYGTGDLAEIVYITLKEAGMELVGVADEARAGKRFLGHTVLPAPGLAGLPVDRIVLATLDPEGATARLESAGVPVQKLVRVRAL